MKYVTGDLLARAEQGDFDIIAHGCNCYCTFGAGIALAIGRKWPEAAAADAATVPGDLGKLGTSTRCAVVLPNGRPMDIVNCYTQYRFGAGPRQLDYGALQACLEEVASIYAGLRVGLPRIGAGHAGGDWSLIERIIKNSLEGLCDVTIVSLP